MLQLTIGYRRFYCKKPGMWRFMIVHYPSFGVKQPLLKQQLTVTVGSHPFYCTRYFSFPRTSFTAKTSCTLYLASLSSTSNSGGSGLVCLRRGFPRSLRSFLIQNTRCTLIDLSNLSLKECPICSKTLYKLSIYYANLQLSRLLFQCFVVTQTLLLTLKSIAR